MTRVRIDDEFVKTTASSVARGHEVDATSLLVRLRLHLPRLTRPDATVRTSDMVSEAERLAVDIAPRQRRALVTLGPNPATPPSLRTLSVRPLDGHAAQVISEDLHYIGCFRRSAENWALYTEQGQVAAYCAVAPLGFDARRDRIGDALGCEESRLRDVCRMYVRDWAPRNTVSYFLSRIVRIVELRDEADMLVTAVDPNLGFTGASYRASNWFQTGRLLARRYSYVDCRYWTNAQLQLAYGSTDPSDLTEILGPRYQTSKHALHPGMLFAVKLRPKAARTR